MKRWMWISIVVFLVAPVVISQTIAPKPPELEIRAQESFARSDYASALPMLQKLALQYKDDAARLASLQEQIRVCQRNLAGASPATQPITASSAGNGIRQALSKPKDGQVLNLTIKDLGNFDYDADKGGNIPRDVADLSGSKLRLSGYMIPMDQSDKITKFALVPSLFACCFGQPPQLQHTIVVNCPKGKAVGYFPDEISVEGTLKVEEKKDDGFIVSVFEMEAASVKPVAK